IPPYARWPFSPAAFASIADGGGSPRELLRKCEQHRRHCIEAGHVSELHSFVGSEPSPVEPPGPKPAELALLDRDLARLRASIEVPKEILDEDAEDELGKLLLVGCELVVAEQPPSPDVDLVVEAESGGTSNYVALHARVRQIFTDQHDRERHLTLRAISREHHLAFQSRLTAAVTASGIDRKVDFRKLILVRNAPVPTGAKTTALMAKARAAGVELLPVSEEDLLSLLALRALREEQKGTREAFEQWLRARRPASQIAVMKPIASWLAPPDQTPAGPGPANAAPTVTAPANAAPANAAPANASSANASSANASSAIAAPAITVRAPGAPSPVPPPVRPDTTMARPMIALGHQVIGDRLTVAKAIPAEDLRQHVVVLAGAGSGKTVLLRRLVEEAALLGIPSIVVDGANDLSRLGEAWPERPDSFTDEDAGKADRYHTQTEVVVWTPGRSSGNPLRLGLLPDFAAVAQDPDELGQAVAMTASALAAMAGKKVDDKGRAILDSTLRYFARQGGGDLTTFLELLADLPEEATVKISTARKLAT
ncbi:MAG: ATPase, partial [Byssovorax sp.]